MNIPKKIFLFLLYIPIIQLAQGQNKGFKIAPNVFYLDANSAPYNQIKAGDTLYCLGGNRDYLEFKNFQGKAGLPIVITNMGGDVIIDTNNYFGISIQNCRYIKLTGAGVPGMQYGFKIKRVANGAGLSAGYLSSDIEIDHLSIENTLLGGLYAKTDPDCTKATSRGVFTQFNTIIHDNYIASTGDEGMYIGSTKYSGQTVNCNGKDTLLMPSLLDGVKIYNNIVKYAGWDAIQVSSAYKNCKIYNNTILFDSQDGLETQMSGIIIGGGTKCDCFNNFISDGKGVGIECHGLGGTRIFNNIIVNPGLTYFPGDFSKPKHGMYISDNSVQKDSSFYIFSNDIINPKSDGIRFSSTVSKGNLISSNVIINPGNYDFYQNDNTSTNGVDSYVMIQQAGTDVTLKNNYFARNGSLAGFLSQNMHAVNDLMLITGSPLIDAADVNPKVSPAFDFLNNARPFGARSDIGAYEYTGNSTFFSGGTISSSQTICSGGAPSPLSNITSPGGYIGTLDYKWQLSTTNETSGFTDIVNSNSAAYSPGILSNTTWFRRLARVTTMTDWTAAAISNVVKVTVNSLTSAVAGANRAICLNTSTPIGAASIPGSSYSWTSSPAGFTSTLANPTVSPSLTTTYTVTETNATAGCPNSHSVTITVTQVPAAIAGANRAICVNSGTQIGASPVSGSTYSWTSSPSGFTSSIANPTVSPSVTTSYILVETNVAGGGCSSSHSILVTVNSLPSATAGANRTICLNTSTQIGSAPLPGSIYSWKSSPAGFTSSEANPVVSPLVTTTYSVIETNIASGCTNTNSVIVTVNPVKAAIAGLDRAICPNTSTQIGAPPVSGSGYSWTSSPEGFTSSVANPSVTPSETTTYNLVETSLSTGCINSNSVKVTVNPLQSPTITGPAAVCEGNTGMKYSTEAFMTGYSWNISEGGILTEGAGTNTITVSWNSAGSQKVSVNYNSLAGCFSSVPSIKEVSVNSLPIPTITGASSACTGSSGITYSTEPNMKGYVWNISSGGTITSGGGTNRITVNWNFPGAQTVNVNYTNTNDCAANAATIKSVIVSQPPLSALNITGITTVCAGTTDVTYQIAPIANATSYVWTLPAGATIASGASTANALVNFALSASSGLISVYGTNNCGSSNATALAVNVIPIPAAAGGITGPALICQGARGLTFTVGQIANATGYTWSIPTGATIVSGNNTNSIVVDLSSNTLMGPITVFGTNNCNKGASSPPFNLTINPIPPAPVVTADGTSIVSSAFQGNRWFFSGTNDGGGSEVQGVASRVFNPTQNGWYWTMVTLDGCTSSPSERIFRLKAGENYRYNIYPVPNKGEFAITITTSQQEEFTIQVFDQLGQKIYEISGLEINGEFNQFISLNSPSTGIYTVVLNSNTGDVFTRKISILK